MNASDLLEQLLRASQGAAQMYLASVLLVDDQQDAERSYQEALAAALNIDPDLPVHVEQQAKGEA